MTVSKGFVCFLLCVAKTNRKIEKKGLHNTEAKERSILIK